MSIGLQQLPVRLQAGGRVLVTRLRHIGDVVLTLPLLSALRQRLPGAEIHYLAEAVPLSVLQNHPDVNKLWESSRTSAGMLPLAARLHRQSFDLAIDLFANPRSALLVFATGAPCRIGEARRVRRHLYTHQRQLLAGRNALQQHLAVIEDLQLEPVATSRPRLYLTETERDRGRQRKQQRGSSGTTVLLHLDASHAAKEWPVESCLELVARLHARGIAVMVGRAPGAALVSQALADHGGTPANTCFLPQLELREYLGVLAACDAVVSVDGGVLHCSVALGTPTVGLFGPTDASTWFPYEALGPFRVLHLGTCEANKDPQLQRPGCLAAIPAAKVEETLLDVLARPNRSAAPL
jgi:ADP-heptose:LPS heptosyltransferase